MDGVFFCQLESILNAERIDAYRQDGADEVTTLSRYLLNMALCESLYSPLQFAEIALRNTIHTQFTVRYGGEDWYERLPQEALPEWQSKQISSAKHRLKKANKAIAPGPMVAELHFGFLTGFFNLRVGDVRMLSSVGLLFVTNLHIYKCLTAKVVCGGIHSKLPESVLAIGLSGRHEPRELLS